MIKIGIFFLFIIFLHFSGNALGIYDTQITAGFVWFDNILHVLVGITFGLLWLQILKQKKVLHSLLFKVFSTLIFVIIMALVWEFLEFIFYKLFTSQATALKIYSPSIQEGLEDIFSNTIGGLMLIFTIALSKSKSDSSINH